MAKKHTMASVSRKSTQQFHFRLREGIFILALALSVFTFIALVTYHGVDARMASQAVPVNSAGKAGAWFANAFLYSFGFISYLFPFGIAYTSWLFFIRGREEDEVHWGLLTVKLAGFVAILLSLSALASMHSLEASVLLPQNGGGVVGNWLSIHLVRAFNFMGSTVILFSTLLTGVTMLTGLSWLSLMDATGKLSLIVFAYLQRYFMDAVYELVDYIARWRQQRKNTQALEAEFVKQEPVIHTPPQTNTSPQFEVEHSTPEPAEFNVEINERADLLEPGKRATKERQRVLFDPPVHGDFPPLALLDAKKIQTKGYTHQDLEQLSRVVENTLKDFNIDGQVVAVHPGPVVTRFELQLAPGVKVNKITVLAKDLARSLSVISVRIVEVIPGKSVIGLELPNVDRETVKLSEVIASQQFEQARSSLSIALGKDIAGHPVIVDLGKMPHLLVAGTTGSGKSVAVNGMLLSLLYKATPEQLRLILIDPKMLELSVYEDIPHLLTPVVTDMKEAANSLRWSVGEMERRYRLMASLGVRNLAGYNQKVSDAIKDGHPIPDPLYKRSEPDEEIPTLQKLPHVVIIIDEFADMMMVVGKKVEQLIARIAQKARAAGIHMILATQRPSVDVITGLIKANVPSRIAFNVSSKIDSRTILDQQGAEQLLGQGDMLYMPPGTSVPVRVHGAFVSDEEVHRVVDDLKKRGRPIYLEDVLTGPAEAIPGIEGEQTEETSGEADPLYDQAVQIVIETRRASISSIQRRLKIGYNRAARLVEDMEAAGLVGPMESNGSREILIPERSL